MVTKEPYIIDPQPIIEQVKKNQPSSSRLIFLNVLLPSLSTLAREVFVE